MEWLVIAFFIVASSVLVLWFRVNGLALLYLSVVCWCSSRGASMLLLSLIPVVYVVGLLALLFPRRSRPAFETFQFCNRLPFGGLIFDKVLLGLIAPHKTLYNVRTVKFTNTELVVKFVESWWLRNPFSSVDVGALVGIGEMVAFGASQYSIHKSGRRAIPIRVSAEFVKKSRGRLTCSARAVVPPVDATTATLSAEIRDSKNDLCCTVNVELQLSKK